MFYNTWNFKKVCYNIYIKFNITVWKSKVSRWKIYQERISDCAGSLFIYHLPKFHFWGFIVKIVVAIDVSYVITKWGCDYNKENDIVS